MGEKEFKLVLEVKSMALVAILFYSRAEYSQCTGTLQCNDTEKEFEDMQWNGRNELAMARDFQSIQCLCVVSHIRYSIMVAVIQSVRVPSKECYGWKTDPDAIILSDSTSTIRTVFNKLDYLPNNHITKST